MLRDIVLVIGDLGNGGTQRVFATLANLWVEQGWKVCIITQSKSESDFHSLDPKVQRLVFGNLANSKNPFGGLFSNICRIFTLRRALQKANARVAVAAVPPTAILTLLASIGLPTRVAVAERNDPARQSFGRYWDFLRRSLYPRAALVTANSLGALESLRAFVPSERLALLPNPLITKMRVDAKEPRPPTILNVGRLQWQKGQDVLIRAFALVAAEYPDWRLAIAGTGKLEWPLRKRAEDEGIADRVDWLGEVTNIWDYYAAASIFVLPSRYEGMPNALLEAMSAGLPAIVTTASPGPLELIVDGVNGLVVPVDNHVALSDAMRALMSNGSLRTVLGVAACERTKSHDLKIVSEQWERVLGLVPLAPATPNSSVRKPDR